MSREDLEKALTSNNDVAMVDNKGDITLGTMAIGGINGLGYLPYIKDIYKGLNLIFHKPFDKMTNEEFKNYGKLGEQYYQNHLQNNPIDIPNYGQVEFGGHNKGKDFTTNMEQYPFLRKQLRGSKKLDLTTNYKDEPDRVYNYFSNRFKGDLYNYLIENIENRGLKYKMMKNKTKGQ